jgi:hypothetical protein
VGHQVSGRDLPCELPAPRAFDLDGRDDEPVASEDGRDDGSRFDAAHAEQPRERREALAVHGEDAARVDGHRSGVVEPPEVGLETLDARGLLLQSDDQGIHLTAACDGVGEVLGSALGRVEVALDACSGGLPPGVGGLRLELVFEQAKRALSNFAVDEGREGPEQGRIDRVLGPVADAPASRPALHPVAVADVGKVVALLGA